jgi:hypothetical protein
VAYDDAGRQTSLIENYQETELSEHDASASAVSECDLSADTHRTTQSTYTPDGSQATMTAANSRTGSASTFDVIFVFPTEMSTQLSCGVHPCVGCATRNDDFAV